MKKLNYILNCNKYKFTFGFILKEWVKYESYYLRGKENKISNTCFFYKNANFFKPTNFFKIR